MEIRRYLLMVRRYWPVMLVALIVVSSITAFAAVRQPWIYESSGTFVVRPRSSDSQETVKAIDTLIRGVEINSTYATIARSALIKDLAAERLDSDVKVGKMSVSADVVTGTYILKISVRGPSPDHVAAYASALGDEAVAYIFNLEDAFELKPLDRPRIPNDPVGPNKPLTIALGVAFGLLLGIMLAIGFDYLARVRRGTSSPLHFDIIDPITGVHNVAYFMSRFDQEESRAANSLRGFSVGTFKIASSLHPDNRIDNPVLLEVVDSARPLLRKEDVLARVSDSAFALLMPDRIGREAEAVMTTWRRNTEAALLAQGHSMGELTVTSGVAEYEGIVDVARPFSPDVNV
jgi:capsular polysaccharide biosynthesis protein/GGDEF domain-containing protein